jgi:hypothetical protein
LKLVGGKILTADVMGARAGELVHDQRGGKIVPGTRQDTEDLLVRAANVVAVNQRTGAARTWISSVQWRAVCGIVEGDLRAVYGFDGIPNGGSVNPSFTEIVEIGKKSLQVYACSGP